MRSRSPFCKISRRLSALKGAHRRQPENVAAAGEPTSQPAQTPLYFAAVERSQGEPHVLYLAGDLASAKGLLRCELTSPDWLKKLQCTFILIGSAKDLHALALAGSHNQPLRAAHELNGNKPIRRPARTRSARFTRKH